MNEDRLMKVSAGLLVFAGALVVLGQLLTRTAIGQVTPEENLGAWLAVIAGGLVLAFAVTVVVMRMGKAVRRRPAQQPGQVNATAPAAQPPRQTSGRKVYNYENLQW